MGGGPYLYNGWGGVLSLPLVQLNKEIQSVQLVRLRLPIW